MLIIPAVDIRGGKVVRLAGGEFLRETVYHGDPVETAVLWEEQGARWLHVVDLDGAREGEPVNLEIIRAIRKAVKIPIEAGGGIRTLDSAERYLEEGITMVILGTGAFGAGGFLSEAVKKHGDKIAVSVDSREGKVAVEGWRKTTDKSAASLVSEISSLGVRNMVFTDVTRDGLMRGVDDALISEIVSLAGIDVTVAGGVNSLEDIRRLNSFGLRGVIIGKALYDGRFDLKEAAEAAKEAI